MSISGGIHQALHRASSIGCTTMQVFTKNSARWRGRSLTDGDIQLYRSLQARTGVAPVIAHAAYLINLCALNPTTLKRSRRAFIDELQRCEALGIRALVFHPGSHLGKGEAGGIRRIVESLNMAHAQTPGFRTITALETTAGQGTALGYRFDHLRDIISHVEDPDRMGVCIDTCHLFAAGYDITTDEGWEATLTEFDRVIGFHLLVAIHVNDSRKPLGSRVDRHEHIGKGLIGLTAFRMLMNDSRLLRVPKILETEKSEDMHEDVENMALLRSLRIHREGE
jgi:deoxyribonuclease-4